MPKRVLSVSPMPPEKCAYALARYSRSPDSIAQSIEWVRTHDSQKFLESFYFQYGHASIADLGHVVLCFEGISELAAAEIEDEQLWDGQARSSRYQDFSKAGFVTPGQLEAEDAAKYQATAARLLDGYQQVHQKMVRHLESALPCPEGMKVAVYERNIAARAFDVARYLLFWGIPTGVGQVTSIRTLERQIRRLKASEYAELRDLAQEIADACAAEPACQWDLNAVCEPIAPTLARHVERDEHVRQSHADLKQWAEQNLGPSRGQDPVAVDVYRMPDPVADMAATLLYPVTNRSYRELMELVCGWSAARRREVIDVAVQSRTRRDHLLRNFRCTPYVFDMVMDIGAYRDMHRHRRCQQFRQPYSTELGFEVPAAIDGAGLSDMFGDLMRGAFETYSVLPSPSADYLLPFATKARFLFKMDFAEAEYICRLRSGVKGHFSYRRVAWEMKEALQKVEPELAHLLQATPPWEEDPLQR